MDNAEIRQIICEKCIVVRGFNNEIQFHQIQKSFPESRRVNLATRTATLPSRDKEWIIQFQSVTDAQRYVQDVRILKCPEGLLDISDCKLPCDIPDEWLQDEVISDKSTGSPKHVSSGTMQPPPYSPSDPSVPPSQHSTSAHGFPPYDPRLYGPNPQNYYQHQYYPPYRMPMNPYHHGSSGKEHLPKDQYRPQHAGQWGQYPGYYQPAPYGSYPGYGYPPQSNFDFHQPVQQLPVQGNLNQYTQGNENRGNTTYHSSSLSETVQNENDVQSDGEESIPVDEDKMEDEPAQTTTNMLKVTKLPLDTTEDGLRFFFENTRKYGGGDVDDVEYDEDTRTAIITFEEDEAVDIVLQKIPIQFNKKVIDVAAHIVGIESSTDIPEEEPDDSSQNTGELVTICSKEVRGMKENTTQDTIMYYFESKKGAKADVETIEFVEDKNMYIVTFENEEAVETVLSKSHIVDGAKLQVKRHVPLKRYPNKALVKGFSSKTTKDGIINFLEARTKFDVEDVDFGDEDSEKAIVTFCEPIDIGDIQTACKKKALDKNYLTVHPVVVTNCIVVRGFSEKTTESGLEYYFDNKRKSGVEGVTDVNMNRDDDCCVIYFENAEDALLACKRSHTIDNCTLNVKVFYDCLGVPADTEGPKFKPLPPLVITDIDKYKMCFLRNSVHKKETLEKQLEKSHSKITWPASPQENKIIVECTITKETKDCRKLAKTWEIDTRMHIDSFVNLLVKEIHSTLQEAWSPVMQKLREIHISDPDGVTVNLENQPTCEIIITGHSAPVKEVSDKVKRIIDEVSVDLDRKKQLVQEEVSLKRHQLFVLSFSHFSNKIRQEFEQMEIKIDTKKHVIIFTGISGNIIKAKVTMYETLSNIASASIGKKTPGYIQFLKRQDLQKSIAAKLKRSSLIGVWEIQDNTILMYSMSDEEAVAAADILKDCVVEVKVDVDSVQKFMLSSQKWKQHVQAIQNEFGRKSVVAEIVTNQQGQITVYCNTQGEAGLIKEKIQDFFLTNTETEITIDLPPSLLKFLQEEMKDEVENLEKDLRKRNIIVAVKSDGILVRGNAEGIKDAEDEVEALVQKIYKTKHSMDKPGLQELMNCNQGKTKLKQVSKHAGVVISSNSDEDERSAGHIRRRGGAGSDERAVFCGTGGQEVIVVKGDITGLDVDVIVNAANKDLAHSGGLAKVLVNKGGKSIQDECDQYTSNYGQLSEGECLSSGPGTLKCQMIVHAVGPVWQGGSNREEERLHQCVETALVETEQNQHTSVAIPALCTGIFGYPANQATRVIAQTVHDYFSSIRGSTVQRVYLCEVNENSVDLFVKAGDKVFGKRTDGGGKIPSGGRYSDGFSRQAGPISTGNVHIKIVKGELSKMKVDAIVNTTSKDLQLNQGAVSAALLKVGGQALQDECSRTYPKGIGYGEVAVTSGYNLPCSYVCHGSLDQWRKDGSSIEILEKFIDGCLQEADSNGCRSIALPAMGTGKLGYPRDLVAKHMYSSIEQFATQNPSSNITEVLVVLYDKDYQTVKAFEDEEQNRQRSSSKPDRDYTQQPTGYQGRRGWYLNDADNTEFLKSADSSDDEVNNTIEPRMRSFKPYERMKKQVIYNKDKEIPKTAPFCSPTCQSEDDYTGPRPSSRSEVLNKVDSDERSKMEQALALMGQKRPIKRVESTPLHLNPAKVPVRKSKSQNAMKNWEKINKPNYWLEDIEIELAMQLVKNNHPNIDGFQPITVALAEKYKKPKSQFIQIINVSGQHWITLSNLGCPPYTVRVFDSLKRHLLHDTKRTIFAMVDRNSKGQVFVDLCQFQSQTTDAECVFFAVASMVAVAYGMDPSKLIWDTSLLRPHLIQCFNQLQMKPFPLYQDSPPRMLTQKAYTLTDCLSCKHMFCEKDNLVCISCSENSVKYHQIRIRCDQGIQAKTIKDGMKRRLHSEGQLQTLDTKPTGSLVSKLVIFCDGRKVNIDSSCKNTSICTDNIILLKIKNDSSRYLQALLGNKDKEFEILMTFSTLLKINLVKPEDWLLPVVEHQHMMACYMLLAYMNETNTKKEDAIINALKMAIEKSDKNITNIICWFIIREYFKSVSFQIDGLLDIWPAMVCKNVNCHEFVQCSKNVVVVVEAVKSAKNLPKQFWNIPIEYLSQTNGIKMENKSTEHSCKNTNVGVSIQDCFPEKFEIDGNLASKLFEKHSKLVFICKSIYTLKDSVKVYSPCVQLFCRRKGLIPIKENHFPRFINNVETNILEGEPVLASRIRAGEKINSKYYTGTLGGFVKIMGDITFITCAHVVVNKDVISGRKLSIPNNESTHIDCVQISPKSIDTFRCGKLRYIEFKTDRPGETSIDAALIALTEGIGIDNDDFIANRRSNKHSLKLLGMKSPFLNENCLDNEKIFYGKHFSQFHNVTIGAISSISVNGSKIDVPEDKEDGIYVDLETIIDTYNKIIQSENQQNVHSSLFSSAAPVFSNNAHTQETRLLKLDKERTYRRLSRSMYNQIAVTHIPFKPGDSGTCVYVCDNSLNAYGCIGMAIANHPGPDGGVILTPMKEILKTFHVDIQ